MRYPLWATNNFSRDPVSATRTSTHEFSTLRDPAATSSLGKVRAGRITPCDASAPRAKMTHETEPTNAPRTDDAAPEPPTVEAPRVGRPDGEDDESHDTLKYQLLGQSLTKAGQDSVDQKKVLPTPSTTHPSTPPPPATLTPPTGRRNHLQRLKGLKVL